MFTLGREIDIHYPTNRWILIISAVVAIIGWIMTGEILAGAYIGGGTFLTWALTREVDPTHEYSAFLCVLLSLLNLFYYENIQLMVIFWLLLSMRLVSGMTGKELTFLDVFSVLGLTIFLTSNTQNSIYLLPFILAMGIIIAFKEKKRLALFAGGIALLTFITQRFGMNYVLFNSTPHSKTINVLTVVIVLLSFVFWIILSQVPVKDDLGNIINRLEILASQTIYSVIVLLLYFFGDMSINNLIIYLAVIVGVIIYYVGYNIFQKRKKK